MESYGGILHHCCQSILDGSKIDINAAVNAVHNNHVKCLEYILQNSNIDDETLIDRAIWLNHIECLKIAIQQGCKKMEDAYTSAVNSNNLECLKLLHINGFPKSAEATNAASSDYSLLECLEFLLQNNHPCNFEECVSFAAFNGHWKTVECLLKYRKQRLEM